MFLATVASPFTTANAEIVPPMCMYEPNTSSSAFSTTATRRKEIFSPIVAVALTIKSLTVPSAVSTANASSVEAGLAANIAFSITSNKCKNCSFLATKSVSELTSNTTPVLPSVATRVKPSAAIRPAFLADLAIPFSRSQSIALATSPSVSVKAFLQSIIPAPVFSRNSFT